MSNSPDRPDHRRAAGQTGEDYAAHYLQERGYTILERNWRTRSGEIDIIAASGDVYVFVEVRTRSSSRFGTPAESVDSRKQRKVRHLAQQYLYHKKIVNRQIRFDVIAVLLDSHRQVIGLSHIDNAF